MQTVNPFNWSPGHQEMMTRLMKREFLAKDTGVPVKSLAEWNHKGLLLSPTMANKWHRFTFAELIWIRVIQRLRSFNYPLEKIKIIRDSFCATTLVDITTALEEMPEITRFICDRSGISYEVAVELLKSKEIRQMILKGLQENLPDFSHFDGIVGLTLICREPISLIISSEGNVQLMNVELIAANGLKGFDVSKFFNGSHLILSLTEVVNEVFVTTSPSKLHFSFSLINAKEMRILEALRDKDVKSVSVRFPKADGEMTFEVTRELKLDMAVRLGEALRTKGYADLTVKTQNGVIAYSEITEKTKL